MDVHLMPENCNSKFTGAASLANDRFDARCSGALDPLRTSTAFNWSPQSSLTRQMPGIQAE